MTIQFTTNIEEFTTTQKAARAKHFTDYASKKQLIDNCKDLNANDIDFLTEIKGTFGFAVHEGGRYVAVTLYKANDAESKYKYLVVDLKERAIGKADSIKNAKLAILDLAKDEPVRDDEAWEAEKQEQVAEVEQHDVDEEQVQQDEKPARKAKKK